MLKWVRNLILVRDLGEPIEAAQMPEGCEHRAVASVSDESFAVLDQFYAAQKFSEGWSRRMLERRARAELIFTGAKPVAAAWSCPGEFYVHEINRRFFPGVRADYYFGDFVATDFRGRGLQRALIQYRLANSKRSGKSTATAMTLETNRPSLANYQAARFHVSGELQSACKGPLRFERLHKSAGPQPAWIFRGLSISIPGFAKVRWK
jgi:GNAT superfamily N-acetyltransferase